MNSRERVEGERTALTVWGEILRRHRRWRGLSRRELAQRAGLSPVYVGEIERGEKDLSLHSLCLLADALGVSLAELYLRVGARLNGTSRDAGLELQTSLPLAAREGAGDYLSGVPAASDETAFDLYELARGLPSEQQVSLLILAQSLSGRRAPA